MSSSTTGTLTNGYNQLYNPIFCNLYPNNKGFLTCTNCNYSYSNSDNVLKVINNSQGSQDCLTKCNDNVYCTSYTNNGSTCTLYGKNNQYPNAINKNVNGSDSGYVIVPPKANYDYNDLSSQNQQTIQTKCFNQYLEPNIDLSSCINPSTFTVNDNTTTIPMQAQCVYDVFQSNGKKVYSKNVMNYSNPNNISNSSVGDPNIQNYEDSYNTYNSLKKQNSNINEELSNNDNKLYPVYYNTLLTQNEALGDNFLENIDNQGIMLNNISSQINTSLIGELTEGFENRNNNKFLVLILIIFFLIFIFFVFKKK